MRSYVLMLTAAIAVAVAGCGGGSSPSVNDNTDASPKVEKVALTVSKFGEGEIVANEVAMSCSEQICVGEYDKDQVVKLEALPASGWSFSHWTGCDVQRGVACEVNLSRSTQIHPYFTIDAPPKLHANVHSLTDETLNSLVSRVGDVFTFGKTALQIQAVKVGDIMLSSRGDGFGVRVLAIRSLRDGNIVVDTGPASLDEIIQEGVLVQNVSLTPVSVEAGPNVEAKLVTQADGASSVLKIEFNGPPKIEGELNLAWNMDNGLRFSPIGGLRELKISANPVLSGGMKFTLAEKKNDPEWKPLPLLKVTFAPFPLGPIVIVPSVTMVYKVDAGGAISLAMTQSFDVRGSIGVQYVSGVGVNGIGDLSLAGKIIPHGAIEAEVGVKSSIAPRIGLMIMGQVGPVFTPSVYAKASGKIDLSDSVANLELCGANASFGLGVAAEAGGELRLFSKKLGEWEFTLFDKLVWPNIWSWPDASVASKNSQCRDVEAPSSPVISKLTPSKSSVKVDWVEAKDNVRVTSYEVYREGVLVGRTGDLSFVDYGLATGKAYCYRLVAIDAAGNKSVPSSDWAQSSGSDYCVSTLMYDDQPPAVVSEIKARAVATDRISLNWGHSSDNVGISSYLVSVRNHSLQKSVGNSLEVEKLLPGTEYCFTVYAIDSSGNSSAQSQVVCASTLPESLASYTMLLGCQNREWLIEKKIDLNLTASRNITYTDGAQDYGGTNMIYHLYGSFDTARQALDAEIRWTFEGDSRVRLDKFTASFANGDSGEVFMSQIQQTGCKAKIRFIPNS